jgi:hypothetical protein
MERAPSRNDHTLAIAHIVDRMALEGGLQPTAIPEIVALLHFPTPGCPIMLRR